MTEENLKADPKTFGRDAKGLDLLKLAANTIRGLSIDGVQKANSGHPGMPLGMADAAIALWLKHMIHDPTDSKWAGRDRFVLSAGHGSMLLYSLLCLFDYEYEKAGARKKITVDDLKAFRQLDSITPGHPEYRMTPGVETTTGPLGQGFANAVGMALAERILATMFDNGAGFNPIEHYTFGIVGDGDLMEGISSEAASLAGHWKLGKLVMLYDDNKISIDGPTSLAFSENVAMRFEAHGWNVVMVYGHDIDAVDKAIIKAKTSRDKPTLIIAETKIGRYSPKECTADCHGSPLGAENVEKTKEAIGFPKKELFFLPDAAKEVFTARSAELKKMRSEWNTKFADWRKSNPEKAALWDKVMGKLDAAEVESKLPAFEPKKGVATRKASGEVIQALASVLPGMIGGSADLSPSNNTMIKNGGIVAPGSYKAKNIHYGVREHAMGAIMNGMALHGGIIPFGGTFMQFADYMRPAIRLAALMKLKVVYVFTHDSVFLGEDGPTHQPVEHLAALRSIPELRVIRPSDANETAQAWLAAIKHDGPTALALTRQDEKTVDRSIYGKATELMRGGYVLKREQSKIDVLLIASGSEVGTALEASETLEKDELDVRVVSMPCISMFEEQSPEYRKSVIPDEALCRVAVEAGVRSPWRAYIGPFGEIVGIDEFGASAPAEALKVKFGLDAATTVKVAKSCYESMPAKLKSFAGLIENATKK